MRALLRHRRTTPDGSQSLVSENKLSSDARWISDLAKDKDDRALKKFKKEEFKIRRAASFRSAG